ncbi:MAG: hypothetical protein ACLSHC_04390 [Bilophila wadsworthia]
MRATTAVRSRRLTARYLRADRPPSRGHTPKTRAMIINSPHSPTGTVYSAKSSKA